MIYWYSWYPRQDVSKVGTLHENRNLSKQTHGLCNFQLVDVGHNLQEPAYYHPNIGLSFRSSTWIWWRRFPLKHQFVLQFSPLKNLEIQQQESTDSMAELGHSSCAGACPGTTTTSGQQSGQCPSPVDAWAVLRKLPENQQGNSQFMGTNENSWNFISWCSSCCSWHLWAQSEKR